MTTGEWGAANARSKRKKAVRVRANRTLALMLGALVTLTGVFGAAQAASAAPDVTYPGAISNITLEKESGTGPLVQWQTASISGSWAVPTGAVEGETFGMSLPAEFSRPSAGNFVITDDVTGVEMATCVVAAGAAPEVVCTLTSAVNGLENVTGTFWLQAQASTVTTNTTVSFDIGGNEFEVVDLPGGGGILPANPAESATPYKFGSETTTDGRLRWIVAVPSGYVVGGAFTITDRLDAGLEGHHYTREVRLSQRAVENGVLVGSWTDVAPTNYSVDFADDNQSFTFSAFNLPESGFAYRLIYTTDADDVVVEGDVFGNHAVVNTTEVTATHTATTSGGGTGTGSQYARFTITKALTGAEADAALNATYTVRYSVKGSDAPAKTLTVPVGEAVRSDRAPLGSTFVIEEIDLPVVDGVEWGAWTITGEGVVAAGGSYEVTPATEADVALTLTNTANPVPVDEPEPSPEPEPEPKPQVPPGELALTGGTTDPGLLVIAGLLIAASAVAGGFALRQRIKAARR